MKTKIIIFWNAKVFFVILAYTKNIQIFYLCKTFSVVERCEKFIHSSLLCYELLAHVQNLFIRKKRNYFQLNEYFGTDFQKLLYCRRVSTISPRCSPYLQNVIKRSLVPQKKSIFHHSRNFSLIWLAVSYRDLRTEHSEAINPYKNDIICVVLIPTV